MAVHSAVSDPSLGSKATESDTETITYWKPCQVNDGRSATAAEAGPTYPLRS